MMPRLFRRVALVASVAGLLGLIVFFTLTSETRTPLATASFWAIVLGWPVAFWSLIGLVCAASVASGQSSGLARLGLALMFLAAAIVVLLILNTWGPAFDNAFSRLVLQLLAPVSILAVSVAQACGLLRTRLVAALEWTRAAAVGLVAGVATLVCGMIAADSGNRTLFKVLSVLFLLDVLFTLIVVVAHRASRGRVAA